MKKSDFDVMRSVISLEMSKGHLKWKVTDLARLCKMSRPLIYYHFGKSKKQILERSFELIAEEFYGLTPERTALVKDGNLLESLRRTHRIFIENPNFGVFYLKWRTTKSPLQAKYLEIERRYQERLHALFPHLSLAQVQALHALLHGLVTAPFLNEESLNAAAQWMGQILAR